MPSAVHILHINFAGGTRSAPPEAPLQTHQGIGETPPTDRHDSQAGSTPGMQYQAQAGDAVGQRGHDDPSRSMAQDHRAQPHPTQVPGFGHSTQSVGVPGAATGGGGVGRGSHLPSPSPSGAPGGGGGTGGAWGAPASGTAAVFARISLDCLAPPELLAPAVATKADNPVCFGSGANFGMFSQEYACGSCGMKHAADQLEQAPNGTGLARPSLTLDAADAIARARTLDEPAGCHAGHVVASSICKSCAWLIQISHGQAMQAAKGRLEGTVAGATTDQADTATAAGGILCFNRYLLYLRQEAHMRAGQRHAMGIPAKGGGDFSSEYLRAMVGLIRSLEGYAASASLLARDQRL